MSPIPGGSITLDQVAAHMPVLVVACSRCDRGPAGITSIP
jgi:hypothetical protein